MRPEGLRPSPVEVGERLRELREARGLRREHLALALDTSAENWRHYEKGRNRPLLEMLPGMAAVFGMTPGELAEALFGGPAFPDTSGRDHAIRNNSDNANYIYTESARSGRVLVRA